MTKFTNIYDLHASPQQLVYYDLTASQSAALSRYWVQRVRSLVSDRRGVLREFFAMPPHLRSDLSFLKSLLQAQPASVQLLTLDQQRALYPFLLTVISQHPQQFRWINDQLPQYMLINLGLAAWRSLPSSVEFMSPDLVRSVLRARQI